MSFELVVVKCWSYKNNLFLGESNFLIVFYLADIDLTT